MPRNKMSRKYNMKNRCTGLVVDLSKIPVNKRDNVFLRDGFYVIGHQDMIVECHKCNQWYSQTEFQLSHPDSFGRRKIRQICRNCKNIQGKVIYQIKNSPDLPPRPDKCEVCNKLGKKLEIDHCHITHKFRGWLCHTCNTASGRFGDNVEVIERLLNYHKEFIKKNAN